MPSSPNSSQSHSMKTVHFINMFLLLHKKFVLLPLSIFHPMGIFTSSPHSMEYRFRKKVIPGALDPNWIFSTNVVSSVMFQEIYLLILPVLQHMLQQYVH